MPSISPSESAARAERAAHARDVQSRKTAQRRAEDPAKLSKAARTVEAGVETGQLDIAEHVRRLVDAAPPLTAEQRDQLAALLRPTGAEREAS